MYTSQKMYLQSLGNPALCRIIQGESKVVLCSAPSLVPNMSEELAEYNLIFLQECRKHRSDSHSGCYSILTLLWPASINDSAGLSQEISRPWKQGPPVQAAAASIHLHTLRKLCCGPSHNRRFFHLIDMFLGNSFFCGLSKGRGRRLISPVSGRFNDLVRCDLEREDAALRGPRYWGPAEVDGRFVAAKDSGSAPLSL